MYICKCGRQFLNRQSICGHYSHCLIHNPNRKRKYSSWNKGLTKDNNESIKKSAEYLSNLYKNGTLRGFFDGKKHTEETKEKIRQKRLEYLSKDSNRLNTAWSKTHKNIMTYGELFVHNLFIENSIYEKYDVVYQYRFHRYCVDFAFVNEKVAVEFDGACHFTNGSNRVQHDIDRDEYFVNNGWRVFRIRYNEMKTFDIKALLDFIGDPNIKLYKNEIIQNREVIKQKPVRKENPIIQLNLSRIESIIKSDINFNDIGWSKQVSELIGISHNKVTQWMRKNMFDFWYNNCRKRSGTLTESN